MKNIGVYFIAILSSCLWGMTFLGSKVALAELTPIEVLAGRWSISMVAFVIMATVGVVKINYKNKPFWKLFIVAIAQPCINCLCETEGVALTTATEASVMYAMIPIAVVIMSAVFQKEKINYRTGIGLIVALAGAVTALLGGSGVAFTASVRGYGALIGMVVSGAVFTLASRWASKDFSALDIVFVQACSGALWFNLLACFEGSGTQWLRICLTTPEIGIAELFLGLIGSCFCYIIFQYAVSKISTVKASMLQVNFLCLSGVLSGVLILGEPWSVFTLIGTVLVLFGVTMTNLPINKGENHSDENDREFVAS